MTTLSGTDLRHDQLFMTYELLAAGARRTEAIDRHGPVQSSCIDIRQGAYTYTAHWNEINRPVEKRRLVALAVLRSARAPVAARRARAPPTSLRRTCLGHGRERSTSPAWTARPAAGRPGESSTAGESCARTSPFGSGIPATSGTRTAARHDRAGRHGARPGRRSTVCCTPKRPRIGPAFSAGVQSMASDPTHLERRQWSSVSRTVVVSRPGETRTFCLCWRHQLPDADPAVRDPRPIWDESSPGSTSPGRSSARSLEFDGKVKYLRFRRPGESIEDVPCCGRSVARS